MRGILQMSITANTLGQSLLKGIRGPSCNLSTCWRLKKTEMPIVCRIVGFEMLQIFWHPRGVGGGSLFLSPYLFSTGSSSLLPFSASHPSPPISISSAPRYFFLSISTPTPHCFHSQWVTLILPLLLFSFSLSLSLSFTIILWEKTISSGFLGPSETAPLFDKPTLLIISISLCHVFHGASSSTFCLLLTC